jgi:APA family basic amino acid/polyamine antiporter
MFSSVAWEGVTFIAGEIKTQNVMWVKFILGTLIVSSIYIIANFMYLSVVPLQEIATAESDRVAGYLNTFLSSIGLTDCSYDNDFDFCM